MSTRTLIFKNISKRELRYAATVPYELRYTLDCECRAESAGSRGKLKLVGHAAVFGVNAKISTPNGPFIERILPGAFSRALEENQDVPCLWSHDSSIVLGRTSAGTLQLKEDSRGLRYSCDLQDGHASYHESVRRGDVRGSSFGFSLDNDGQSWDEIKDEESRQYIPLRTIRNVSVLRDVSPVLNPAYSDVAEVTARSVEIPVEIRSACDARNMKAGLIVSPEVALQITINAMERRARERESIARRKSTMNNLLS